MKHFYAFLLGMMTFLLLGTTAVSAAAADKEEESFGEMQLNKEYIMKDGKYFYGTFTPTEDGYLQVYSDNSNGVLPFKEWKDNARTTMALENNRYSYVKLHTKDNIGYNYEMQVKKGVTYYMCGTCWVNDNIKITLKMEPKKLEFLSASVEEGAEVTPTGSSSNYTISWSFNRPVTVSSASVLYGNNKEVSTDNRASSSAATVTADLKATLLSLASAGSIKKGDEITIVMKGIKEDPSDVPAGEQPLKYGDISFKVKVGDLATTLLNATLDGVLVTKNTKFLTYYAPGTGILKLNFSNNLETIAEAKTNATLMFGSKDDEANGAYYQEKNDAKEGNFTMKIEGNSLIIDFSGKHRAVSDMVSSTESTRGADFTVINLQISNVTDVNGNKVYSTSSTTSGRINYTFSLDVPETNVQSEFDPANGASIKNVDDILIWINDEQSLVYQGVAFSYNKKENGIEESADDDEAADGANVEIVVKKADIKRENAEEEGAVNLTVPVPEEVKDKNNVTVSLYKVTCADGKDYSNIIAAKYNVVTSGIGNNIIVKPSENLKVYNLNGQLVREGKNLDGLKGIYIVNGKKVVLK